MDQLVVAPKSLVAPAEGDSRMDPVLRGWGLRRLGAASSSGSERSAHSALRALLEPMRLGANSFERQTSQI